MTNNRLSQLCRFNATSTAFLWETLRCVWGCVCVISSGKIRWAAAAENFFVFFIEALKLERLWWRLYTRKPCHILIVYYIVLLAGNCFKKTMTLFVRGPSVFWNGMEDYYDGCSYSVYGLWHGSFEARVWEWWSFVYVWRHLCSIHIQLDIFFLLFWWFLDAREQQQPPTNRNTVTVIKNLTWLHPVTQASIT